MIFNLYITHGHLVFNLYIKHIHLVFSIYIKHGHLRFNLYIKHRYLGPVAQHTRYSYPLDKVVHWTTTYPVDNQPVDNIGCSKSKTMVGQISTGYNFVQWTTPIILCTSCVKAIGPKKRKKKKKGLLSSATFQVIFQGAQFICSDLQMTYDQSFCYLCVGAGNLCLHRIVFQVFVSQIMINHTFVF